jgi:hypothetical protein
MLHILVGEPASEPLAPDLLAVLAYFQGALLLAKAHNDASVIDSLADHAITLVFGTDRNLESA